MYDVKSAGSGITLPVSGTGNITTTAGAMYRGRMEDGMLTGVRFDTALVEDTAHVTIGLSALPAFIGDDRGTDANEANTKVTVAGQNLSLGDLMGAGMAAKPAKAADGAAGEFVNSAVEILEDLRTEAELYAKYQAAATTDGGRGAFDGRLTAIAHSAQDAVDMIFGDTGTGNKKVDVLDSDPSLPREVNDDGVFTDDATDYIRATQTVRGLNRLLDALSPADAFVAATQDGNNGVFEGTYIPDLTARGRR